MKKTILTSFLCVLLLAVILFGVKYIISPKKFDHCRGIDAVYISDIIFENNNVLLNGHTESGYLSGYITQKEGDTLYVGIGQSHVFPAHLNGKNFSVKETSDGIARIILRGAEGEERILWEKEKLLSLEESGIAGLKITKEDEIFTIPLEELSLYFDKNMNFINTRLNWSPSVTYTLLTSEGFETELLLHEDGYISFGNQQGYYKTDAQDIKSFIEFADTYAPYVSLSSLIPYGRRLESLLNSSSVLFLHLPITDMEFIGISAGNNNFEGFQAVYRQILKLEATALRAYNFENGFLELLYSNGYYIKWDQNNGRIFNINSNITLK